MIDEDDETFSARRSLRFYRPGHGARDDGFWSLTFVQDISNAAFRVRDYSRLEPASEEFSSRLCKILECGRRRDVLEELDRFLNQVVGGLAYEGRTLYEVLRARDGSGAFRLVPLPLVGRCISLPRYWLQIVPKESRKQTGGRRFALIPKRDVWSVSLPPSLGSPRSHRALVRTLSALYAKMPDFVFRHDGIPAAYSFAAHRRASDVAVARSTRHWGWTGRSSWKDDWLESAEVFRILRFTRSKRLLVEHVVRVFNDLLTRERVGGKITLDGPGVDQIDRTIEDTIEGRTSFVAALKFAFGNGS